VRSELKYFIYRGIAVALQLIPESAATFAASSVSRLVMKWNAGYRSYYEDAICRVLGDGLSEREIRSWSARVSGAYARYWVDGIRLNRMSGYDIDSRMMVDSGMDHLVDAHRQGNGVILALAHMGSWEWGGAWLFRQDMPLAAVAEVLEPPKLFDWFSSSREAMGITVIPLDKGAAGKLSTNLHNGGLVGLICDRDVTGQGVEVDLFGDKALLPPGPALLSLRTGAAVLPTVVYQGHGGIHIATISAPAEYAPTGNLRKDVAAYTQEIIRRLESLIRRAPDQWYIFSRNWISQKDIL
jgi:KDO2-lipid IV(A) lauroyltransferase